MEVAVQETCANAKVIGLDHLARNAMSDFTLPERLVFPMWLVPTILATATEGIHSAANVVN